MKDFNHSLLLLGVAAVLPCSAIMAKAKQEKPNILFICIDDLRTQIGAYEKDFMITPNLDQIASHGRLFNNHFVQVPTSGPSRACMLTGRGLTDEQGVGHTYLARQLAGKPEGELPETFVHHLKRNGYYTVGMGKVSHNGNGLFNHGQNAGEFELPHSWDKFSNDPDSPWPLTELLHAYADGMTRSKYKNNPAFEFLDVPDNSYPDARLADRAIAELELLAEKTDEPFFMAVGFYKPHLPFCAPKKYWDMYEDTDIALSPNPDVPEGVDSIFLHPSSEFFGNYSHPEYGGLGIRVSDAYAKDVRRGYYAALTYTDTQVGRVMSKFKELGLDENTIVIVWGDHGWHLGDQTIWGKHSPFDRALNSTLIVDMPEMKQRGKATDQLVATIDIYPTVCELAGVEVPEGVQGTSFVPMLNNTKAKTRDAVISYWYDMLSLRTDRYRFALYNKDGDRRVMLFDHDNDPYETVDVSKSNPELVKALTEKVKEMNNDYLKDLK